MQGHFKKRGASWYFWIELEPGPDGARNQKSLGGFKTRKEAERAFADMRNDLRRGAYVEPSKLTLTRFLEDEWFPAIRASVRPTTWEHYHRLFRNYIRPSFGRTLLPNLTPARLNAFYAELLERGRLNGDVSTPGLAPKTVKHVHTMLHKALDDAVRWSHLTRNPASLAKSPKPRTPEMKVWTPEQLRAFIEHARAHRLFAAWLLAVTTGMRRGEVLDLAWEHVDLRHGRVSVVRSLTVVDYHRVELSEPKTAKGRRSIALDPATTAALKQHRKQQHEERFAVGSPWQDSGLVFTRDDGSPIHPQRFSNWFGQLGRGAGLPRIRLHDLRHSYATAALSAGIPAKVVSERLGHASVAITLDTYSHVHPALQEEAAHTVARLILGDKTSPLRRKFA
ncbi:MAG: tyrosine-type recombinase/integrase [Actinomycetota bacterium]